MTVRSLAVHPAEFPSRESGVGALGVVVVVNVGVPDHSWELHVVQLFAGQQLHILERGHAFDQLSRFLELFLVD